LTRRRGSDSILYRQALSLPDIVAEEERTIMRSFNLAGIGAKIGIAAMSAVLVAAVAAPGVSAQGKGDLVVGVTSDADTLFPWKATQFQAFTMLGLIYDNLVELDQNLDIVPGLAESWEASDDGMTVTFALREGVTFHDGTPMTSADVKASLDAILLEETGAVARAAISSIDSVDAPDDSTVVLNLSTPDAGLLAGLVGPNVGIVPADATEEELSNAPNGTGPFAFAERAPNESLTLVANDDYWRDGEPTLGSVEFRVIPDEASIVDGLRSGAVQLAELSDPIVALTAEGDGIAVEKTPQLAYHVLMINHTRDPLGDVNVRLAMQCAIDRQEVLDTAALGEGTVIGPITSPAYLSDPSARPCPERDVDRARELLAEAGYEDGVTIGAMYATGEYATAPNEAQSLQGQLAEAGITLELEPLEIGAYVDRWLATDFDTAVALNGGRPDPDTMYGRYFPSAGNLNKVATYSSDTMDELFAQGKASSDPEERKQIYADISRELEDNAVWIWMFAGSKYSALTDDVQGFVPMPSTSLQYLRTTTVE
jgi:peptide/nickel transport system substrate-binding protein